LGRFVNGQDTRRANKRRREGPSAGRCGGNAYLGVALDALHLGGGGPCVEVELAVSRSEPQRRWHGLAALLVGDQHAVLPALEVGETARRRHRSDVLRLRASHPIVEAVARSGEAFDQAHDARRWWLTMQSR